MFTGNRPRRFGKNVKSSPRFRGTPGVVKLFQVADASFHASVIWYASSLTPVFVIVSSRLAFTIREPVGTCPAFGPMREGNLRRLLHTVPRAMQSTAST